MPKQRHSICVKVVTPGENFSLQCIIHRSESPEERAIEAAFYKQWCPDDTAPKGHHHELEVVDGAKIKARKRSGAIHIHIHPENGKAFVCWTGALPTFESAENLFRMWAVGTVYTLVHDKDFQGIYAKHEGDTEAFLEEMNREHKIHIEEKPV